MSAKNRKNKKSKRALLQGFVLQGGVLFEHVKLAMTDFLTKELLKEEHDCRLVVEFHAEPTFKNNRRKFLYEVFVDDMTDIDLAQRMAAMERRKQEKNHWRLVLILHSECATLIWPKGTRTGAEIRRKR